MRFCRSASCIVLSALLAGCAHQASAPTAVEGLVGDWASPVAHGRFMRFTADGKFGLALAAADLGVSKTTGTWSLAGTSLAFTNLTGACSSPAADRVGVYTTKLVGNTLQFSKLEDACEARSSIDGETWTRLPSGGEPSAKTP